MFEADTKSIDLDSDTDDEVNPLSPLDPFTPFSPPNVGTPSPSPPWTPNLHPCQAPLFVTYTDCRHDYTRSDERVVYGDTSSDSSPGNDLCTPGCHHPARCLRHFPFTFGCRVCIDPDGWHPPLHPDINGTPQFIKVGRVHPNDLTPSYTKCEMGRLVPTSRIYLPVPMLSEQEEEWVDASPSSTASSDIERHAEIQRQTFDIRNDSSPT